MDITTQTDTTTPEATHDVFTVVERGGGHVNRDGSLTLKLYALPVNGTLHVCLAGEKS